MTTERNLTDSFTIGNIYNFQRQLSIYTQDWMRVVDIIPPSWVVVKEDRGAHEELVNLNYVVRVTGICFNKSEKE